MAIETYTDVQAFLDGTGRWLWQVMYKGHTWRAGVENGLALAQDQADRAIDQLHALLNTGKGLQRAAEGEGPCIDFDALERGIREDER